MNIPPPWYCYLFYIGNIVGFILIELERKPALVKLLYKDLNA